MTGHIVIQKCLDNYQAFWVVHTLRHLLWKGFILSVIYADFAVQNQTFFLALNSAGKFRHNKKTILTLGMLFTVQIPTLTPQIPSPVWKVDISEAEAPWRREEIACRLQVRARAVWLSSGWHQLSFRRRTSFLWRLHVFLRGELDMDIICRVTWVNIELTVGRGLHFHIFRPSPFL